MKIKPYTLVHGVSMLMLLIISFVAVHASKTPYFQLLPGDLLFQDLDCGTLCDGIDKVTYGVRNTYMSHVGIVISTQGAEPQIIEAIGEGVIKTSLSSFLHRSHDENGYPRVVVGRLANPYKHLIPEAIVAAKGELGKPYNTTFYPNDGESQYCSQLIYDIFKIANHDKPIFHLQKMDFKIPGTSLIVKEWSEYFKRLHAKVPQGMLGNNPGMMSREKFIQIVFWYGQLRQHRQN